MFMKIHMTMMDQWIDYGFGVMYSWAKDNDCDGVEGIGRAGFYNWTKKEKGWKETSRFFEIKFPKGESK